MSHSFNVYIDESGDDGMTKFRNAGDGGGASNWLAVGACVVRSSRDLELVALRDRIRQECRPRSSKREIHFKDFNHNQKRRACQIIAGQPLRFSCVLGLKNTPNAETFVQKNQLYFYLTRYLIERVSWLCRDKRRSVQEGNGMAKIIFSRRGGLSYDGFRSYLERLRTGMKHKYTGLSSTLHLSMPKTTLVLRHCRLQIVALAPLSQQWSQTLTAMWRHHTCMS